jgi:hypothetical protein
MKSKKQNKNKSKIKIKMMKNKASNKWDMDCQLELSTIISRY